MAKRKAIPKAVRFEVFKRDKFTCQYCGAKAPEALLVVDHINPVASGGDNDIMNLATACEPCNAGKGARKLGDDSALERQRQQLEALSDRREQLEMMLAWREGLAGIDEDKVAAVVQAIRQLETGYGPNDDGLKTIRKWVRKHTLGEILDAVTISFDQYAIWDGGKVTSDSWDKAFEYIPRVINGQKLRADKPYLGELFYVRGILRNRCRVNERECMAILEDAHLTGVPIEVMKDMAKAARSWPRFRAALIDLSIEGGDF